MTKETRNVIRREVDEKFEELGITTYTEYLQHLKSAGVSPQKQLETGKFIRKQYLGEINEIDSKPKNLELSDFANVNLMAASVFAGGIPTMVAMTDFIMAHQDSSMPLEMLAVAGGSTAFYFLSKAIANGVYNGKKANDKRKLRRKLEQNTRMMFATKYAMRKADMMREGELEMQA